MAREMSEIEMPSPLMRTGFSHTRIAYAWEAATSATDTPSRRITASFTFCSTKSPSCWREYFRPSVANAYIASMSELRFCTEMPCCFTMDGSFASARLTAFWRLTSAMSESAPLAKVTEQE